MSEIKHYADDVEVTIRTAIVAIAAVIVMLMIVGNVRGYMSDKLAMEHGYTRAALPGIGEPQWVKSESTP